MNFKKLTNVALAIFLFASLVGCADESSYISTDKSVCEKILFTCPQFERPFENRKGCGCEPNPEADDPDARTLDGLVQNYLLRFSPSTRGGESFAEFIHLQKLKEEDTLFYGVFALTREYFVDEAGKLREGDEFAAPVILEIEETGRAYIIRGSTIFDEQNESEIRANFTAEVAEWSLATTPEKIAKINLLRNLVETDAFQFFNLPITYWSSPVVEESENAELAPMEPELPAESAIPSFED